ncbi:(deoxy)nucleoside triphosphate pyrophosphohydrolase [Flavihumibacter profundi]|uniref:(deoxy)nucleoside triphosphate pyrophosphohydrolase n=1 Tax=Flavihumibacter profundi TaxID=2716883 RepID=UPI001CC5E3CC|nr:(deoxy)nucleoside triphosphate pyrophosphohydrolase [Flavihumibacter profundi]MBZ5858375.1 (deoxy)nucleoside triphosphate pyrophosphohydrolase [Flavihumibacter profundi]
MIDVACAIIIKDNKILVVQRSEQMKLPLKWEFPGGKIEENETAENCIKREIKEELNIEIEVELKIDNGEFDYGMFSIKLYPFIAKYLKGELILAEHKAFKWLRKDELKGLDWAAADMPVLENFLNVYHD